MALEIGVLLYFRAICPNLVGTKQKSSYVAFIYRMWKSNELSYEYGILYTVEASIELSAYRVPSTITYNYKTKIYKLND